jgi:hypothetical protein
MFFPRIAIITKAAADAFVFDSVCDNISGPDCEDVKRSISAPCDFQIELFS